MPSPLDFQFPLLFFLLFFIWLGFSYLVNRFLCTISLDFIFCSLCFISLFPVVVFQTMFAFALFRLKALLNVQSRGHVGNMKHSYWKDCVACIGKTAYCFTFQFRYQNIWVNITVNDKEPTFLDSLLRRVSSFWRRRWIVLGAVICTHAMESMSRAYNLFTASTDDTERKNAHLIQHKKVRSVFYVLVTHLNWILHSAHLIWKAHKDSGVSYLWINHTNTNMHERPEWNKKKWLMIVLIYFDNLHTCQTCQIWILMWIRCFGTHTIP